MVFPELLPSFLYSPPPSIFISAMSIISFLSLTHSGFMESKGKNMQYAKFFNNAGSIKTSSVDKKAKLSGRIGMVIFYTPPLLVGMASFAFLPNDGGLRFDLLRLALIIHFFKRVFEVLFIHKFSGEMEIEAAIIISLSYFVSTASIIYAQHLTNGLPEPSIDLMYVGILLFLLGITGNFYHHYLLSKLRSKGDEQYKIPQGGLFNLVICPHYLFEIIGFIGVSCIAQTLYALSFTIGTLFLLMGRSIATRRWYLSKFDNFPKNTRLKEAKKVFDTMSSRGCKPDAHSYDILINPDLLTCSVLFDIWVDFLAMDI
ncbi:hypothetical protein ACH5RR_019082 [Cinchona calisaya]|uniref:3-oxo-5-alpha-steroid 4-dehydrogenase C-terminal domain-containing protein n=1 Tax=Cinchona calisaya TaxID=153742 RepID=A0ABD2ZNU8_9GENT